MELSVLLNYCTQIFAGFGITFKVFAVCLIFSIPLGVLVALGRISKNPVTSRLTELYIWVLRGTPLLLQLMVVFFVIPSLGRTVFGGMPVISGAIGLINSNRLTSAYIAFVLNYSAYFGEIFRSGIQSIERGQREAAKLLGFNSWQINMKIILPQVFKRTLPAIGNEVITLVKDTSLVYILGVNDILKLSRGIANRDATMEPFLIAGVMYLVMTYVVTKIMGAVEKRVYYDE